MSSRIEYKIERISITALLDHEGLETALNKLGEKKWTLCSVKIEYGDIFLFFSRGVK